MVHLNNRAFGFSEKKLKRHFEIGANVEIDQTLYFERPNGNYLSESGNTFKLSDFGFPILLSNNYNYLIGKKGHNLKLAYVNNFMFLKNASNKKIRFVPSVDIGYRYESKKMFYELNLSNYFQTFKYQLLKNSNEIYDVKSTNILFVYGTRIGIKF